MPTFDTPPTPGADFTTTPADRIAPTLATFSPLNDATGVNIGSDIVLTFSESIATGTGNIVLTTAAGALVATYDAATSSLVSVSGQLLTINPLSDLSYGTGYRLEFAAGTVIDLAGNRFAGLTSYHFTTGANPANQTFIGSAANDSFKSGKGDDTIDGAGGIDTAVYNGNRSSYTLTSSTASITLADTQGTDGTDTLTHIERLQFLDKKLAMDLSPAEHAGQALEFIGLMAPSLVNAPSIVGLILDLFDQGKSLHDVCQLALDVGLVDSIAGSNSNAALAAMAFRNVVGSEPDAAVIDLLLGYMDGRSASFSQAEFMRVVAGLDVNQAHIGLMGLSQTGIEYV